MQVVIDIPEDTYRATCTESMLPPDVKNVVNAIKNGIPLPKGHGDLIDRYTLSPIYRQMSLCSTAPNFIWVSELMGVEPAIKADKEVKNADSN